MEHENNNEIIDDLGFELDSGNHFSPDIKQTEGVLQDHAIKHENVKNLAICKTNSEDEELDNPMAAKLR